eukprot:14798969-Ditylum_brightwellii.AAC.1
MSSDEAKSESINSWNQLRQLKNTIQHQQITPAEEQLLNHLKNNTRERDIEEEQVKTEIRNQHKKRKKRVESIDT